MGEVAALNKGAPQEKGARAAQHLCTPHERVHKGQASTLPETGKIKD